MGVVNVTPDSFSDGGLFSGPEAAVAHALRMASQGALILDIGGESTRPGAEPVSADVEMERVIPVIRRTAQESQALISVDTTKPEVAREAIAAGAHLVNDVRGATDEQMLQVCSEAGVPVVIMHMRGEPRTMQQSPYYLDVVAEVADFLRRSARRALDAGVPDVILDPGIGFGKTVEHNLALLRSVASLAEEAKVLVGASRKGFIAKVAGECLASERDPGSIAVHLHAASQGAALVRVHDVAAHVQALRLWERLGG